MRFPAIALALLVACGGSSKKSATEPPMEPPPMEQPPGEQPVAEASPLCESVHRLVDSWEGEPHFASILGPPGYGEGIFTTELAIAGVPDGKCLIDDYDPVTMCQLFDGPSAERDPVYDEVTQALSTCLSEWIMDTAAEYIVWRRADGVGLMIQKEHDDAYEGFGVYLYFGNLEEE